MNSHGALLSELDALRKRGAALTPHNIARHRLERVVPLVLSVLDIPNCPGQKPSPSKLSVNIHLIVAG